MAIKNDRHQAAAQSGMDVYISAESAISGDLQTQSNIVIEGSVNGKVTASGNVHIGGNSKVEGDITAADVQIAGTVNGNIVSTGGLILFSGAKLNGDVKACGFTVEKGAYFKGSTIISSENSTEESGL
jgi:Integral membrane protein CcmA involved in cell shape determination